MKIETSRFGSIEVEEAELIRFESGLIGFQKHKNYILIPHGTSAIIAWLQSTDEPDLAFPVVSAHGLISDYPDVAVEPIAQKCGLGEELPEMALLVVLSAPRHQPATVNLLAPLVINSQNRKGAQVFLEGSRFTTRELFVVPQAEQAEQAEEADADDEPKAAAL